MNKQKKSAIESGRARDSLTTAVALRERAAYIIGSSSSKKTNPTKSRILVKNFAQAIAQDSYQNVPKPKKEDRRPTLPKQQ